MCVCGASRDVSVVDDQFQLISSYPVSYRDGICLVAQESSEHPEYRYSAMPRDDDDDYFPSTPIRRSSRSPDKPSTFGSGSVSSSIASSPRRHSQSVHDGQDDIDEPSSPAVQQLKKGGFASVRVGLGSPGLMKRTWTASTSTTLMVDERRGSGDRIDGLPEVSLSNRPFVDQNSGLPTPPGTESDIGPPPLVQKGISLSPRKVRTPLYLVTNVSHHLKHPHLDHPDIPGVPPPSIFPTFLIPIRPAPAVSAARLICSPKIYNNVCLHRYLARLQNPQV